MHLRLNKSRLEIKRNLAVRVNDRWNSFTKACGMCAVTGSFELKCVRESPHLLVSGADLRNSTFWQRGFLMSNRGQVYLPLMQLLCRRILRSVPTEG